MVDKVNFKFSIITPTYNRKDLLQRIWNSLENQKLYISEWIIIDDGSEDETKELIKNYKKESSLKIIYEYSKNRGMTHAINTGLKYVQGDYFFKLDSDDYLLENSLVTIYKAIIKIQNSKFKNKIKAFSFLTSLPDGKIINKFYDLNSFDNSLDEKIICLDYVTARYMNLITGDLLDVFKSYPLLDHFRYPVINDERHTPSSYISYFNADYFQDEVAYVLENVLVKNYQHGGISWQRKNFGSNVPNKSLKSYLIANLSLLNISSKKMKPLFLVYKSILKIFIILFFSCSCKFIGLFYLHFKKLKKRFLFNK